MRKPNAVRFTEQNSGIPVAKPLNLRVPTQSERILQYVRYEQMRAAQEREVETFEDADDFEMDDGEEWISPFEEIFEAAPEHPAALQDNPPPAAGDNPPPQPVGGDDVPRSLT